MILDGKEIPQGETPVVLSTAPMRRVDQLPGGIIIGTLLGLVD